MDKSNINYVYYGIKHINNLWAWYIASDELNYNSTHQGVYYIESCYAYPTRESALDGARLFAEKLDLTTREAKN